jgi:hypothetical protein
VQKGEVPHLGKYSLGGSANQDIETVKDEITSTKKPREEKGYKQVEKLLHTGINTKNIHVTENIKNSSK